MEDLQNTTLSEKSKQQNIYSSKLLIFQITKLINISTIYVHTYANTKKSVQKDLY